MILRSIEHGRVEVALYGNIGADDVTSLAEVDVPVETKHIGTSFLNQFKHGAAIFDEVNDRDTVTVEAIDQLLDVRKDIALVIVRCQ